MKRLAFLAVIFLCVFPQCSSPPRKWNIVVLVPDTIRADHLGVNGYDRKVTPHLDALAAGGTNFADAITVAPRTWQSFASILTGRIPPNHGVRFIGDYPLKKDVPTLATELGAAGYETRSFDRIQFIRKITDGHGFDEFYDEMTFSDQALLDETWKWIEAERQRPFFAFIRLNGAHWPYEATPYEMEELDPCDGHDHSFNDSAWHLLGVTPAIPGKGMRLVDKDKYRKMFFNTDIPEAQRRHIIAHYDAELRQTDAAIGSLIDRLREANLLDQTIIVVTADHGESFGEHGYLQHGPKVDEPVVRVPLIIRLPKEHPFSVPGSVVREQVSTTDIFPTLLSAVGVKVPGGIDGTNLLPAMKGESLGKRWAYAESGKDFVGASPEVFVDGIKGKQRMIRYDGWKLVYIPKPNLAEYQLFHLKDDPMESRNVAREFPERVKELRAILEDVLEHDEDDGSRERELTDAEKEQLRQLGYM